MTEERINCPMRHLNGNCLVVGGFCTAVNDTICEALHHAYDCGQCSIDHEILRPQGEWESASRYMLMYRCSICKEITLFSRGKRITSAYCPNCGAKMKGAGDNG